MNRPKSGRFSKRPYLPNPAATAFEKASSSLLHKSLIIGHPYGRIDGRNHDNRRPSHDIMRRMWRVIFREILVFLGGLSIFVGLLVFGLAQVDSFSSAIKLLYRGASSGALLPKLAVDPAVWIKVLSPYLVIQVLRAYRWSQRSVVGRRWANIYFTVLLGGLAFRSFWSMCDLFLFMYAMGDIPAELGQFVSLESGSILVFVLCSAIATYCLRTALWPKR